MRPASPPHRRRLWPWHTTITALSAALAVVAVLIVQRATGTRHTPTTTAVTPLPPSQPPPRTLGDTVTLDSGATVAAVTYQQPAPRSATADVTVCHPGALDELAWMLVYSAGAAVAPVSAYTLAASGACERLRLVFVVPSGSRPVAVRYGGAATVVDWRPYGVEVSHVELSLG